MKFNLIFEKSGDYMSFDVYANYELFEFFVNHINSTQRNNWTNSQVFSKEVEKRTAHLNWAVSKTNEVLYSLIGKNFVQHENLTDYLNQSYLNRLHKEWVDSQYITINIDQLKESVDLESASIGWKLHDMYPDEFREDLCGAIMSSLGYLYPYEQVNKGLHQCENVFKDANLLLFTSGNRYDKIDNPIKSFYANNDACHFSFDYTFVGRQYYDKWRNYDTNLDCNDHYNYQYLEHTFNLNFDRAQKVPFSEEFLLWCKEKNVPTIGTKIPIA